MSSSSPKRTERLDAAPEPPPWGAAAPVAAPEPVWGAVATGEVHAFAFPELGAPAPPPEVEEPVEALPPPDLDALEEEARQRGYEAGYTAGHGAGWATAEAEGQAVYKEIAGAVEALRAAGVELEERYAQATVELACRVARHLVGDAVAAEPARLARAVRTAVASLRGADVVVVHASPEDVEALREFELAPGPSGLVRVELVADEALARGGWRVESSAGGVDGSVEDRLARIRARLQAVDVRWDGHAGAARPTAHTHAAPEPRRRAPARHTAEEEPDAGVA